MLKQQEHAAILEASKTLIVLDDWNSLIKAVPELPDLILPILYCNRGNISFIFNSQSIKCSDSKIPRELWQSFIVWLIGKSISDLKLLGYSQPAVDQFLWQAESLQPPGQPFVQIRENLASFGVIPIMP